MLDDPQHGAKARYLFQGVVDGISFYGNAMGIPTVAGEVGFNPSYRGNCLVGAMSVGVVKADEIASSAAAGIGNTVMYFGNATGRDGIGGCSVLASHEMTDLAQRPTVQVGDPFSEKCLLEATLEALRTGAIVSMKDMGAAGLTCTTCEQAASGGDTIGMDINLDKVPLREADMEAFEIMMSESQERMLGVVARGREAEIIAIFEKWNTHAVPIGTVTDDGMITVRRHGEVVAQISALSLVESPLYHLPSEEPAYFAQKQNFDFGQIAQPQSYGDVLLRLLQSPNIASKEWVYEQYDHMVQINTVVRPGAGDAAVLRLRDSRMGKGLAVKADCNSRYVYLDPFMGAQIAIAECARNLICVGAEPAGVTDCLCFGNPEKPDRFWQFKRAIEGITAACSHFRLPVVSGNVSLYNETPDSVIHPSPLIGMVGVLQNVENAMEMRFRDTGDLILLAGSTLDELGGSEYLFVEHNLEEGKPPHLDLHKELNVHRLTLAAIRRGLVKSAHDVSDGGLAVAIAECCIAGDIGASIELPDSIEESSNTRLDALLFGETQSRVVLSCPRENLTKLQDMAHIAGVPLSFLGTVGGAKLNFADNRIEALTPLFDFDLETLSTAYRGAIGR
jgi:phosphoribosylformylglycinamidine synthase